MTLLAFLVGIIGAAFTVFACVRLLAATRSGAPRELALGWMALMLFGAILVFATLRLL